MDVSFDPNVSIEELKKAAKAAAKLKEMKDAT